MLYEVITNFNQDIDITGAPIRGKVDAPVTLVLFSDFQCPWCGRLEPVLTQLEEQNQGKLRIAFKHMPLAMHQYAESAALAAIAAQRQGKFWEMHDALFNVITSYSIHYTKLYECHMLHELFPADRRQVLGRTG